MRAMKLCKSKDSTVVSIRVSNVTKYAGLVTMSLLGPTGGGGGCGGGVVGGGVVGGGSGGGGGEGGGGEGGGVVGGGGGGGEDRVGGGLQWLRLRKSVVLPAAAKSVPGPRRV
tara:strand:- start:1317 stop:1655 length:339 start_codon:yes stop_codon:yes gene_type:complete